MISDDAEREAKGRLKDFIEDTHGLIKRLVYEGFDVNGRPFFFEDLTVEIKAAWEEFEKDFNLDKAFDQIYSARPERLQISGLYGKQLNLKLSVVKKWRERFERKCIRKNLLKVLDAIDTVLDSLLAATGINEALKEIKDILRNSID